MNLISFRHPLPAARLHDRARFVGQSGPLRGRFWLAIEDRVIIGRDSLLMDNLPDDQFKHVAARCDIQHHSLCLLNWPLKCEKATLIASNRIHFQTSHIHLRAPRKSPPKQNKAHLAWPCQVRSHCKRTPNNISRWLKRGQIVIIITINVR